MKLKLFLTSVLMLLALVANAGTLYTPIEVNNANGISSITNATITFSNNNFVIADTPVAVVENTNVITSIGSTTNNANGTYTYAGKTSSGQLWNYKNSGAASVGYGVPYWTNNNGSGYAIVNDTGGSITMVSYQWIFDLTSDWTVGAYGWAANVGPSFPASPIPAGSWYVPNTIFNAGSNAPTTYNYGMYGNTNGLLTLLGNNYLIPALIVTNGSTMEQTITLNTSGDWGNASLPSYMFALTFTNVGGPGNFGLGGEANIGNQAYWCGDLMSWGWGATGTTNYTLGRLLFYDDNVYNPSSPNVDYHRLAIDVRSYDTTGVNGVAMYIELSTNTVGHYGNALELDHNLHMIVGQKSYPFQADAVSTLEVMGDITTHSNINVNGNLNIASGYTANGNGFSLTNLNGGNIVYNTNTINSVVGGFNLSLNGGYQYISSATNVLINGFTGIVATNVNWTSLSIYNSAGTNILLQLPTGCHCVTATPLTITNGSWAEFSIKVIPTLLTNSSFAPVVQ